MDVCHLLQDTLLIFSCTCFRRSTSRTTIADKIGNDRGNISKDENLARLLDSFNRDKPKGHRGIPSWKISLVLHQLTKPPFEPLNKASLKHQTLKKSSYFL